MTRPISAQVEQVLAGTWSIQDLPHVEQARPQTMRPCPTHHEGRTSRLQETEPSSPRQRKTEEEMHNARPAVAASAG